VANVTGNVVLLGFALAVIVLGAVVSYLTGRSDPAWVHPPAAK
jgi:hypothetical protein